MSCSPTVRAVPLLDAGFAALPAGLVSGTAAAGAVDGSGSRAAFALDGAFAVAITTVFITPVAMGASVRAPAATTGAADALVTVAKRTVPPATSAAECTVVV